MRERGTAFSCDRKDRGQSQPAANVVHKKSAFTAPTREMHIRIARLVAVIKEDISVSFVDTGRYSLSAVEGEDLQTRCRFAGILRQKSTTIH